MADLLREYGIVLVERDGCEVALLNGEVVPPKTYCELVANLGQGSRVWMALYGIVGGPPEVTYLVGIYNILQAVFSTGKATPIDLNSGAIEAEEAPGVKAGKRSGVRRIAPNKTQYGTAVPTSQLIELLGDHIPR